MDCGGLGAEGQTTPDDAGGRAHASSSVIHPPSNGKLQTLNAKKASPAFNKRAYDYVL
jgi:hypothetical protein